MVLARMVGFHLFHEILDSGNDIRSYKTKEMHYMNPCNTLGTEVRDGWTGEVYSQVCFSFSRLHCASEATHSQCHQTDIGISISIIGSEMSKPWNHCQS